MKGQVATQWLGLAREAHVAAGIEGASSNYASSGVNFISDPDLTHPRNVAWTWHR